MFADIRVEKAENLAEARSECSQDLTPKIADTKRIGTYIGNRKRAEFRENYIAKRRFLKHVSIQHRSYNERTIYQKLKDISGPTSNLPLLTTTEKKFSGRNRLYVGNLSGDVDKNKLAQLFQKYGETDEIFINREKNFGFVRMDYHHNAKKAKFELNGIVFKGKTLKVRLAPSTATIKVKNLDQHVTNELLHLAFSVFGEVERSVVVLNASGKSTGTGIVEFSKRSSSNLAIRKCKQNCFFLTSSLQPIIVEAYKAFDDNDGLSEKFLSKKNHEYYNSRSVGPHFAVEESWEHQWGMRFKHLDQLFAHKLEVLETKKQIEELGLLSQLELARFEQEMELLNKKYNVRKWKLEQPRAEGQMCRMEKDTQTRMVSQEQLRRGQEENTLFLETQQPNGHQDDIFKWKGNLGVETKATVPAVRYHYTGGQYGRSNRRDYWNYEGVAKRRRY